MGQTGQKEGSRSQGRVQVEETRGDERRREERNEVEQPNQSRPQSLLRVCYRTDY